MIRKSNFFHLLTFLFCFGVQQNSTAQDKNEISSQLGSSSDEEWKRVYLASYPRSGNHWLRFLIEEATHIATSSVYPDQHPPKNHLPTLFPWGGYSTDHGYRGNCRYPKLADIVVIKTHLPCFSPPGFDAPPSPSAIKSIRIIRHPVDSFFSYFIYEGNPMTQRISKEKLTGFATTWRRFQEYWDKQENVVTIRYEDLYNFPYIALKQVLQAIGYKVKKKDIKRAIAKFPQQGKILKHVSHFHAEDLKFIEHELKDIMTKYNYIIPQEYFQAP
jgi:hypothetical protein